MSYNKTFPIGVDNNPLVNSLWNKRDEGVIFAPGQQLLLTTEGGDLITTENGEAISTE